MLLFYHIVPQKASIINWFGVFTAFACFALFAVCRLFFSEWLVSHKFKAVLYARGRTVNAENIVYPDITML
jgi:hypothetical protein